MRGYNFISKANEAVGRITKQNQTHDVGPNEIKTQAKKFGNSVDKDGRPPVLHSKAKKNTKPNTLFNLGMAEGKKEPAKPRDPSFQTMVNIRKSGAGGAHRDKKKEFKQGKEKKI